MNLVERAKAITLTPDTEWPVIAGEQPTLQDLFTQYAIPLAAIGPIAGPVGSALLPFGPFRLGLGAALGVAITSFVMALVGVLIVGFIVNALAPTFGATKNQATAHKLAVYAMTPAWLGGIFGLVPLLAILGLVASAWSVYLLYLGLPTLMGNPKEKSMPYAALTVVCAIVVGLITSALTGALFLRHLY